MIFSAYILYDISRIVNGGEDTAITANAGGLSGYLQRFCQLAQSADGLWW